MFDGWENYYLMVGSSAGALIGLMFVVVTLTAGRDRGEVDRGKHLYTSPIVWQLGVTVVLSGAAAIPTITAKVFAVLAGGLALLGIGWGVRSAVGILRRPVGKPEDCWFDAFWYGIAPALVYVGLGGAAFGMWRGWAWGETAVAVDLMALLLVSIHAEWDLVTFLAPMAGKPLDGGDS
jgi:lysylphosphatidylglycerol synthetase-like protein (DUF2156 family)